MHNFRQLRVSVTPHNLELGQSWMYSGHYEIVDPIEMSLPNTWALVIQDLRFVECASVAHSMNWDRMPRAACQHQNKDVPCQD